MLYFSEVSLCLVFLGTINNCYLVGPPKKVIYPSLSLTG